MHEHVLSVVTLYETKSFGGVEPLHCTRFSHCCLSLLTLDRMYRPGKSLGHPKRTSAFKEGRKLFHNPFQTYHAAAIRAQPALRVAGGLRRSGGSGLLLSIVAICFFQDNALPPTLSCCCRREEYRAPQTGSQIDEKRDRPAPASKYHILSLSSGEAGCILRAEVLGRKAEVLGCPFHWRSPSTLTTRTDLAMPRD
jgi:hypothetical protein